ncbi:MAG: hypothetical protein AAGA18_10595 [Verrucomicrobiota bacterium]
MKTLLISKSDESMFWNSHFICQLKRRAASIIRLLSVLVFLNAAHADTVSLLNQKDFPDVGKRAVVRTVVIYSMEHGRFLQIEPAPDPTDASMYITLDLNDTQIPASQIDTYMLYNFKGLPRNYHFKFTLDRQIDENDNEVVYGAKVSRVFKPTSQFSFAPVVLVDGELGWLTSYEIPFPKFGKTLYNLKFYSGYVSIQNYEVPSNPSYEGYFWATNDSIAIANTEKINISPFATKGSDTRNHFKVFILGKTRGPRGKTGFSR